MGKKDCEYAQVLLSRNCLHTTQCKIDGGVTCFSCRRGKLSVNSKKPRMKLQICVRGKVFKHTCTTIVPHILVTLPVHLHMRFCGSCVKGDKMVCMTSIDVLHFPLCPHDIRMLMPGWWSRSDVTSWRVRSTSSDRCPRTPSMGHHRRLWDRVLCRHRP